MADRKTLSQKCLKVTEEVGELAKAILPFDSAPGTNHRFVDKNKILEEIADVHLTNISIAYSLGFTDEEINDMVYKKSIKWSEMQAKEDKAQFPLPFEIHITISSKAPKYGESGGKLSYLTYVLEKDLLEHPHLSVLSTSQLLTVAHYGNKSLHYDKDYYDKNINRIFIENFKRVCSQIKVKPIVLDLEIKDDVIKDVMTSSKHFGDNRSAYEESQRIVKELKDHGFEVLRTKIETVPWHPKAPSKVEEEMPEGCYFESHIGVAILPEDKDELDIFVHHTLKDKHLIRLDGTAKLSQNFFKKSNDGSRFVNMLTYRSHSGTYDRFSKEVDAIKTLLVEYDFQFEKVEVEFSVYDTNVSHDSQWIKN